MDSYFIRETPVKNFKEISPMLIMQHVICWLSSSLLKTKHFLINKFFQIPELAGFWMISLLLQLPLQGFLLLNPYFYLRILEICVQGIMFLMLIIQLVSGYFALKYTAAQQATYFRIMKLNNDVTVSNFYEKYKEL